MAVFLSVFGMDLDKDWENDRLDRLLLLFISVISNIRKNFFMIKSEIV